MSRAVRHSRGGALWGRRNGQSTHSARFVAGTALVAVLSATLVGTGLITTADPASATTPGTPGIAQPSTLVFGEDFQNGPGSSPIMRLTGYEGIGGETYTAAAQWLQLCNGWIASANQSTTAAAQIADCNGQQSWNSSQQLAQALGMYAGQDVSAARDNYAVSAFTAGDPGAGRVEFQTASNVPLVASNRFIAFSVDVAAVNCSASAPLLQFSLLDGAGQAIPAGSAVNACASTGSVDAPAVALAVARPVTVGTSTSNGAVLFSGDSLGVRLVNNNGSGGGNDHAFDNIRILDVTPQLDKSFSPASVPVGSTSTLTFTITNTAELAAKNGWSFTDALPTGLTVAGTGTTDCPAGVVTAVAGSSVIAVAGNLSANMISCTASVPVTSGVATSYSNGPDNITGAGVNPPGVATVNFTTAPTPANLCTPDQQRASERFWRFGNKAGIDFGTSGTTGTAFTADGDTVEGSTVVTDSSGTLQFWSNGQTVFNRNSVAMVNGTGLLGNPSATQTVAAFPLLGQPGKYVVATTSTDVGSGPNGNLSYSIVDMALDGGLGAVVAASKNLPLGVANTASEALTAIPNVDGTGFWVLSYTNNSPNITAYEFDGDGYTGTAVTSVLPSSSLNGYGSLNFSADGTQLLALTNGFGQPSGNSAAKLRLLGFDAATGAITQRFEWAGSSARGTHGYTADFSPSGDYVYFSRIFSGGTLYRYTIAGANTATQIKASEITVGATGTTGGQVKRAPDGRMYVANSGVASLSVVNTPDAVTPGFVAQGFPLAAGSSNRFGLPQMVTGCLPLDFGDAPDSYGTLLGSNGAVHSYKAGLTLGTKWDAESDGQPSAGADGDDLNGSTNDEDGIASPIVVKSGAPTVVDVTATNNTDTEATLASWIDLNGNGTFEPGELQQIAVPANSGTANYALTWPGQASTSQPTYARFRLFEGTVATPSPDGAASGGEVEDHLVAAASFSVQKTASATSVIAGETLGYTVTVTNTGQLDFTSASPASFTDDLSAVLDDAVYNDDATNGAVVAGGVLSWFGALAAGASKTISYSVTVGNPITGDGVLTNAVVPGGEGHCKLAADCVTTTPVQSFSVLKNTTATEVDPGAVVVYTITVTNTGEVGYTAVNPASFSDDLSAVLDDASYDNNADNGASYSDPVLSWSGPLAVGASVTITYSVTVDDPTTGDSILKNTVVTPPGTGGDCLDGTSNLNCTMEVPGRAYTVAKSANKAEVFPGGTVVYTVTVKNTGALDYTAAAPASFTDDLTAVLDDAVYNGDADNGASVTGNILSWSGPLAIGETVEIHYSVTVGARSSGDGTLTNTVTPTTRGGDCDPAGVCTTDTAVQSYSVEKSSDTTMVAPGGTVVYTVTVKNTGTVAYTAAVPASFTDDLSAVLDDASYNGDATNDATVTAGILSWSGALAVGETTTVVYSVTVTVTDPASGNGVMTNAAIPDDETGGECLVEECPSVVTNVSTFTVAKSASVSTVSPGGTVVYTVTVENTGTVAYTAAAPASFTDDLSAVLDDATYNNDATGGATVTADVLSWSGALAVGETKTVTYSVTVNDPATGNRSLENSVVPEPGTGGSCKTPGGCITTTLVRSFEVVKSSSATTAIAGDTVTYTIVVRNTGLVAYPAATPASFLDNLGGVLDDATYNNDVDNGATVTGNVLSWSGPLALGATVTITYSVTVDSPVRGDHKLVNTVVTPPGTGSVCEVGSLDPDCTTSTPIAGYSTVKSADATNVVPGETVTYTIVVTNTGEVAYTAASPASFTDDLSEVLDDADYNGDATGGAAYSDPVLSWSDALGIGETKTITYSVTIKSPNPGNQKLVNAVVTPPGIGGSCPVGSTDARCISRIPGPMLQVLKSQSASSVLPGGTVEYTIEVTNTGEVDFTVGDPASFSDDLGQLLDDAVYNGDVTGGAVYSAPMLSWSGPLASGDTHTVTYSVTVDSPSTGNHLLDNAVTTPPNLTSNCPALSTDPACTTRAALASFSVAKVADAVTGTPGDVITYSVTVTNTGQVDYSAATPASFSDDLAEVLDDAVYNDDATGGATVTNGVLSWEGELAIGQTVTVRYSVTVSSPATGDRRMINAVVPDESVGGHCTDPADCLVTTPVASYSVSKAASAQKIRAGEVVTYTITVSNTGQVEYTDADPASFTDDLGDVLSLARYNGDASGRASFSSPVLSWAGALGIGENLDVTYSVTVGDGVERGVLRNAVVVPPRSGGLCIQGSGNPECTTETDIELPSLPFTGGDFAQGALVSLLLTAGGVGLVLFSRLRRKSSLGEPGRVG